MPRMISWRPAAPSSTYARIEIVLAVIKIRELDIKEGYFFKVGKSISFFDLNFDVIGFMFNIL